MSSTNAESRTREAVGRLWDALELIDARLDRLARARDMRARRASGEQIAGSLSTTTPGGETAPRKPSLMERLSPGHSGDALSGDRSTIAAWRLQALDRRIERVRGVIPDLSASQAEALREWMLDHPRRRAELIREIRAEGRTRDDYLEEVKRVDAEQEARLQEILNESQYRKYRKEIQARKR